MKLATLRDGSRDGRLVVVSRDLTRCSDARHIAPTLQAALDDWATAAPQLELIARGIEGGAQPVERFHERDALVAAALRPRRRQPVRRPDARRIGLARASRRPHRRRHRGDRSATLPAGADEAAARAAIRLVMLTGGRRRRGRPEATAFSPVAVTPDEPVPASSSSS